MAEVESVGRGWPRLQRRVVDHADDGHGERHALQEEDEVAGEQKVGQRVTG